MSDRDFERKFHYTRRQVLHTLNHVRYYLLSDIIYDSAAICILSLGWSSEELWVDIYSTADSKFLSDEYVNIVKRKLADLFEGRVWFTSATIVVA